MSDDDHTFGPAVDSCLDLMVITGLLLMGPIGWIILCCMIADGGEN